MSSHANRHQDTPSHHDGDGIRRRAYEEAMARFAGRRGIGRALREESLRFVRSYDGPVVVGDLERAD